MSASSSSPRSDLLIAIRAFAGARFEVLGELGADGRGDLLYLARERGGEAVDGTAAADRLVGLRVEAPERALRDDRTVALTIESDLDALVGATPRCTRCAVPVAVAGATMCRSCTASPLSGELVRERSSAPLEIQELLDLHRLDGWVPEGAARTAPDGTPFHYVRDAAATRALLLFLRAERAQPGVVLLRPCLAPAFADGTPLDSLPHLPSAADTLGAIPRTDPTGTAAGSARGVVAGTPADESTAGRTCPQCGSQYAGDMMFCPRDGTALRVAGNTSSLVGSVIAERYHVLGVLGEGGMGRVYLAEHVKIRRRCALKVMSEQLSRDVDAVGRFVREAENAARVAHPNVAAVYDFGETPDGQAYLAMELVDGESLSEILRANGGLLPPPRAAEVARQVALGLAAAHELGIVHRDLKPDNVMITRGRDGRDLVKVVDFGIAKAEHAEGQQITRTGLVIGTPEYMSPEQLLGEPLDGRSDLFSLGCILYRMLTGRAPFATGGGEAVLARLTVAPEPPSSVQPQLTPAFDAVTMLALASRPERRAQSAQELAEMLAPLAGGGAAGAPAPAGGRSAPVRVAVPSATAERVAVSAGVAASAGSGGRWRAVAAVALLGLAGAGSWAVFGRGADEGADAPTLVASSDSGPASGATGTLDSGVAVDAGATPIAGDGAASGQQPVTPLRGPAVPATGAGAAGGRPERPASPPSRVEPAPRAAGAIQRLDDARPPEAVGAAGSSGSTVAVAPAIPTAPTGAVSPPTAPTTAGDVVPVLSARDAVRESAAALIARYERAINDRNPADLRGMCQLTRDQQQYWRDFLGDTRNVKAVNARLRIVQISGDTSPFTLDVAGAINYRDLRNASQSVPYRARLRASGDASELTCGAVDDQFGK